MAARTLGFAAGPARARLCYKTPVVGIRWCRPLDFSLLQHALRTARGRFALVLAALALLATFLLGGFRPAPPKRTPVAGAGERVVSGALAVEPVRAWLDRRSPRGYEDSSGQDFLVLEAVVENLTDASSNHYLQDDLRWLADMDDQKGREADVVYLADDLSLFESLHPRLPVRVLLCWKIAKDRPPERPMRWGLFQRRYFEKAYVNNESGWKQDGPGYSLKLVADDRRDAGTAP